MRPETTVDLKLLLPKLDILRRDRKTIVFTNGCFDILHAGHVRYLSAARREGDVLVVGLNSDASVRALKGKYRPINAQALRAEVLAGLWCVDYIVVFDRPDPLETITAIMPDVLVKGADWKAEEIVGADVVARAGGRIVRIPLADDISTSRIIEKIREWE